MHDLNVALEVAPGGVIEIDYTNWRGERSKRRIAPKFAWFGVSEFHLKEGCTWFLCAVDVEKNEVRDFCMKDMHGCAPYLPTDSEIEPALEPPRFTTTSMDQELVFHVKVDKLSDDFYRAVCEEFGDAHEFKMFCMAHDPLIDAMEKKIKAQCDGPGRVRIEFVEEVT